MPARLPLLATQSAGQVPTSARPQTLSSVQLTIKHRKEMERWKQRGDVIPLTALAGVARGAVVTDGLAVGAQVTGLGEPVGCRGPHIIKL